MTRLIWEGIPEKYWPDTETPWRVAWGIGCFRDFATRAEADLFHSKQEAAGVALLERPFDATALVTP